MKKLIICVLREKYKNYQTNLFRQYLVKYNTNEKIFLHVTPDVIKEYWVYLMSWFNSKEFRVVSVQIMMGSIVLYMQYTVAYIHYTNSYVACFSFYRLLATETKQTEHTELYPIQLGVLALPSENNIR